MLAWIRGKGTFIYCWWECKLLQLQKQYGDFLKKKKLNIDLPNDPSIPLLGM
jgi:hypothetical protein